MCGSTERFHEAKRNLVKFRTVGMSDENILPMLDICVMKSLVTQFYLMGVRY